MTTLEQCIRALQRKKAVSFNPSEAYVDILPSNSAGYTIYHTSKNIYSLGTRVSTSSSSNVDIRTLDRSEMQQFIEEKINNPLWKVTIHTL